VNEKINKKIRIVFSEELLSEFIEVIQRPVFTKYFYKDDLQNLIDFFDVYADFIEVSSKIKKCRDPKDDFLLSLAVDSKADYLLTGDEDLLDLKKIDITKIITFTDFVKKV
jgi:putative PIN family toxin of toxin-antitoxin system